MHVSFWRRAASRGRSCRLTARTLLREEKGTVAIFFGLATLPLLLSIGAALDYSRAAALRSALDAAADEAVLAAVDQGAMTGSADAAEANARRIFARASAGNPEVLEPKASVRVSDRDTRRTATLTYTAEIRTVLMGIAGFPTVSLGGKAQAVSARPSYVDYYLLLDNTPSMGIGATLNDIAVMVGNTPDKCAFACHDLSTAPNNYYNLAKKLGVTTRIDVVRSATQQLMDTAARSEVLPGQFRAAIYTLGTSCSRTGLTPITALTSVLSRAKADAAAIDLMRVRYQGDNNDQCTDYRGVLEAINRTIGPPGSGESPSSPQKVLFFVSDGVSDSYYPACPQPTTGGRCQEPIDVAQCEAIKRRGIRIAVLYTTYLPLPTNDWYTSWVKPFSGVIAPRMQQCASPGLFFEVAPSQGISEAMIALFQKTIVQPRLTN
jgi:Flp pilus assembly protein TadG